MSLSLRNQLAGLHPYVSWSLEYILTYAQQAGAQFSILSTNRTPSEQHALFQRNPSRAARAGCSQHQYGLAADVQFARSDWQDWYLASVRNFGLTTVEGDRPHVQAIPGAVFREWAQSQGLCPDPRFPHGHIEARCGVGTGATSVSCNHLYGCTCRGGDYGDPYY